jgi:hypothetical protein
MEINVNAEIIFDFYLQARDAGLYECQVSTEPKVSARVHLHVVGMSIINAIFINTNNSIVNHRH